MYVLLLQNEYALVYLYITTFSICQVYATEATIKVAPSASTKASDTRCILQSMP